MDDAQVLVDSLTAIFDATTQKCFKHENGKIAHLELKIDDTIVMISDSTEAYEGREFQEVKATFTPTN
ncbi:hypothetical protein [Rufibacter immobilis]|uniref:hypothetical protein n=1 Tax=Rufibacter immobilis TaxID=1348778 RepID=UPI0035ECFEB1